MISLCFILYFLILFDFFVFPYVFFIGFCPNTCIYYSFLKKGINYRKGLCPVAENVIKKSIWINQIRPPTTKKDIKEMTKLNKNKKFSISSFNNNGVEYLTSYLFTKCEIDDDQ